MIKHIFFQDEAVHRLNELINIKNYSAIFILVDENTNANCLNYLLAQLQFSKTIEILEVESGEINKNIYTVIELWQILSDYKADRHALMLNLGGGVITDLGGFVASTYKRGIEFIQVPTTLLAMIDAAIGGKNGIDLGYLKNQIGTINQPNMVLIFPEFLNTLSKREWRSGLAEMLKHGLIYDVKHWEKLKSLVNMSVDDLTNLIKDSAEIKLKIISQDPNEMGLRKILNFGHTLGHAIESYALENQNIENLLHGEAIAIGMILEAHLSYQNNFISLNDFNQINEVLLNYFEIPCFEIIYEDLEIYMLNDKKNRDGIMKFVLLKQIGEAVFDQVISKEMIISSLKFLKK
jgi:3-dehydroquinate synthase